MTDLEAEQPDLLGRLEHDMAREESSDRAAAAAGEISTLLDMDRQVGDLIRMDFGEAHVLVHDALRQQVGGVPHGCLLLAARTQGLGDSGVETGEAVPSLLLLRVLGSSALPNDIEMQQARFQAGQRASDSPRNWDENQNTDQFTLHQMRYAGLRCSILGTFRMVLSGESGGVAPHFRERHRQLLRRAGHESVQACWGGPGANRQLHDSRRVRLGPRADRSDPVRRGAGCGPP